MPQPTTNTISIKELIKYARLKGQTGRLLFLEDNQVCAEVFFKKGHLRHAKNSTGSGNEVIYQLAANRQAQIRWERNSAPTGDSIDAAAETALLDRLGLAAELVHKPPTGELVTPPAARNGRAAIIETK